MRLNHRQENSEYQLASELNSSSLVAGPIARTAATEDTDTFEPGIHLCHASVGVSACVVWDGIDHYK